MSPTLRTADDAAWLHDVFERYESRLIAYCARLTSDFDRARDIVQDAFVRLCAQPRAKVEPIAAQWLYTVCRNRALDVLKKENRMNPLSDQRAAECPSREPDQAAALEQQEAAESACQLLERLPARQQELIRLKLEGGLTYRQMAEVTGLSVSNVGYLLHSGLQSLRTALRQRIEAADM